MRRAFREWSSARCLLSHFSSAVSVAASAAFCAASIVAAASFFAVAFSTAAFGSTDSDNDGLSDPDELTVGTGPTVADSDGDTVLDGDEVGNVLSPRNTDGVHARGAPTQR